MPMLGLEFSMLEATPVKLGGSSVGRAALAARGASFKSSGNMAVVQSPIGSSDFKNEFKTKTVTNIVEVYKQLATLPSKRAVLHLATYQASRLNYLARATPRSLCNVALRKAATFARAVFGDHHWVQHR